MEEKQIESGLLKVINKWRLKTQTSMLNILKKNKKGNSNLAKLLTLKVKATEKGFEVTTDMPDYAVFVDQGRKPGKQPPLKTIQQWCKEKGINQSAAFPIARKIGERGIKPTNFLKAFYQFKELIADLTKQTAIDITKTVADDINKNNK